MKSTFDEFLADLIKEENERVRKETEERVKKETEILLAKEMLTDGIEINQIAKYCKGLTKSDLTNIQADVLNPV